MGNVPAGTAVRRQARQDKMPVKRRGGGRVGINVWGRGQQGAAQVCAGGEWGTKRKHVCLLGRVWGIAAKSCFKHRQKRKKWCAWCM